MSCWKSSRINRPLLPLLLLSLFACPAGLARADFESMEIKLDGELMDAAFKDVNGDKNPEIIVATRKTDETGVRRRRVTIYSQKSSAGAFEPVREIEARDDAIAFAAGDFLREGSAQILFMTAESVLAIPSAGGEPKVLIPNHRFFFNRPDDGQLPYWDYVQDLNGDGRDDLVLADANGYVVYLQSADQQLARAGRVEGDFSFATAEAQTVYNETFEENRENQRRAGDASNRSGPPPRIAKGAGWAAAAPPIITRRRLGRLAAADANGDKRPDLLTLKRDKLLVYMQTADGKFGEKPDAAMQLGPRGQKQAWDESRFPVAHGDINGDGRVDFVVSEIEAKELTTKLRVYLWGEDGMSSDPNQIIKVSGLGESARLVDVNGDGYPDLGYLTLRADKMLSLKKPEVQEIDATYYVYLYDPAAKQFTRKPGIKHEYTVAVTKDLDEDRGQQFANFKGDFNGDGARDLMLFENKGELLFHFTEVNKKDRMEIDLPSRPSVRQAIERPKSAWIADLDGDGKSDVVLNFKNHLQILRAK